MHGYLTQDTDNMQAEDWRACLAVKAARRLGLNELARQMKMDLMTDLRLGPEAVEMVIEQAACGCRMVWCPNNSKPLGIIS